MVGYRIVQYCKLCKKRYIIEKGEKKSYYCEACKERMRKAMQKENKK